MSDHIYDYMVVGSGLFGAVFAHEVKKAGKSVIVVEKRDHIAGNIYTKPEIDGINVHVYGPHIFHTNSETVWRYVNQFATFNNFVNRVKAMYCGKIYSMPINLMTFHQVAGCVTPADAAKYLELNRQKYHDPKNLEEWIVSQVGWGLYDMFIRGYTRKQWMRDPKDLPASIIKRLPIRLTYDDNYYDHRYQGIPIGGYTQIVEKMLDGIKVECGVDFFGLDWQRYAKKLVYTGPIDQFFNYENGELDYRTLEFRTETHEGDYQGNAQINYTEESIPFTRIIEHKHFEFGNQPHTIITKEYPVKWEKGRTPYLPLNDEKNNAIYRKYKKKLEACANIIVGGRLGSYAYYDMDQTVASALQAAKRELGYDYKGITT
jgi:UDP-galactopyranose mutase